MIKIVNGVFGYNDGTSVVPKTSKDEPFSCDKATEKRLVSLGVAKYVTGEQLEVHDEDANSTDELVNFSKDELIAEYKSLGLGGNPKVMKEETLIKKIKEAKEALEEVEEDDEDAPNFDEVDGVEG